MQMLKHLDLIYLYLTEIFVAFSSPRSECVSAWNRAAGVQFLRLGLSLFEQPVSYFRFANHLLQSE